MYSIHIIIIIKNENIKVTLCENAAGALYISINTIQYLQQFPHLFRIKMIKDVCIYYYPHLVEIFTTVIPKKLYNLYKRILKVQVKNA